ncbi:MAG: LysE family translocator [Tranquillimonas sp.]|jgi:threonine/homoserine/homoserine lactone efflux protein
MPVDLLTLAAFVPAALALNLTPGADMMFCLAQGLRGGPRAALAADAGIAVGVLVHVLVAGLGLSAAVAAAPWLLEAIRWIGIGYLLWLARQALRARAPAAAGPVGPARPARAFRDGLAVNLTNPKVILFVLAFLPQFVDPARAVLPQFLVLGAILALGGLLANGAVGLGAGRLGRRLARSPGLGRLLGRITAAIYAGLALRLVLMQRS